MHKMDYTVYNSNSQDLNIMKFSVVFVFRTYYIYVEIIYINQFSWTREVQKHWIRNNEINRIQGKFIDLISNKKIGKRYNVNV